jgi:septum site-determining protein MinC
MKSGGAPPLQIKADREGFSLVPDPVAPFQTIRDHLEQRLEESHDFFFQARVVLDLRARPFRAEEIEDIRDLLNEKGRIKLVEVRLGENLNSFLAWASQHLGIPLTNPPKVSTPDLEPRPLIVRSTCRSGTRIESPSDCLVLGDVNPGAEIIAVGDIFIFGILRGLAHAGATGDRSARIWALSIDPNQIRIADLVAVPPKGDKTSHVRRFEVAEVQAGHIQVTTI